MSSPAAQTSSIIRVIIADDHVIVRDGMKRLLESEPNLTVVGQATNGMETLRVLVDQPCDLLLLDLTMAAPSGARLVKKVREGWPNLPILVVTMHNDPRVAQSALHAGANGFITKDAEPAELLAAVYKVASGARYVLASISEGIAFLPAHSSDSELSGREKEVLFRLAAGQSNAEIAGTLFISEKTVSTHKTNIMSKLGVSNLAELIRYADSIEPGQIQGSLWSENSDS
jgi:DNA-binding NarL/FixJ family response regulator